MSNGLGATWARATTVTRTSRLLKGAAATRNQPGRIDSGKRHLMRTQARSRPGTNASTAGLRTKR